MPYKGGGCIVRRFNAIPGPGPLSRPTPTRSRNGFRDFSLAAAPLSAAEERRRLYFMRYVRRRFGFNEIPVGSRAVLRIIFITRRVYGTACIVFAFSDSIVHRNRTSPPAGRFDELYALNVMKLLTRPLLLVLLLLLVYLGRQ